MTNFVITKAKSVKFLVGTVQSLGFFFLFEYFLDIKLFYYDMFKNNSDMKCFLKTFHI